MPSMETPALVPLPANLLVVFGPNVKPYFSTELADILTTAITQLNKDGIVPYITSAFRDSSDQKRMQQGASGSNPAAKTSLHQAGYAVDVNTRTSDFKEIKALLMKNGLSWGGYFRRVDPPHFFINPFGKIGTQEYRENLESAVNDADKYYSDNFE